MRSIIEMSTKAGFPNAFLVPPPADQSEAPWAQSVLLMVWPYAFFSRWPDGFAEVSAYYIASNKAHQAMLSLLSALDRLSIRAEQTRALRLKPFGEAMGLGVMGKNTLLRNDAWGSRFTMRALYLNVPPENVGESMPLFATTPCGECTKCQDACPTGALSGDGCFSWDLCMRAHMFTGKPVKESLRAAMGTKLLGCDICQRACPHNEAAPLESPIFEPFAMDALLRCDAQTLSAIAPLLGKNEAKRRLVLPQAILAAGNSGKKAFLPAIEQLCEDEDEAVREHVRWAVKRE